MTNFSETLRGLRETVGYNSARSFFKGRGGQIHFGCTYRQYLNVETGRSSPGPRLLEKIAVGLRLTEDKDRARKFFTSYLRSVHRSEDLVRLIVGTFSDTPDLIESGQPPMVKSMARVAEQKTIVLSKEQDKFVTEKKENYWPFVLLASDKGHWDASELSESTGIPAAGLKKSLDKLLKLGLVAKDSEGKYYSKDAGALFRHPQEEIYLKAGMPVLQKLWDEMAKEKGEGVVKTGLFTRASEAEIRQFLPYLMQCLKACDVCTTVAKGHDTAFFEIQVLVRKVLPF